MKSYKDITSRYLKEQKKRTLLTIFGIILSVSLITAIATIILSVRDGFIEEALRTEGAYHGVIEEVAGDKIEHLSKLEGIKRYGVRKKLGSAPIAEASDIDLRYFGGETPYKYLEIEEYGKEAFGLDSIKLKEGRIPKNSEEILIEDMALKAMDKEYKLGDRINLEYGNRIDLSSEDEENGKIIEEYKKEGEKEFTIVGIIEPKYYWNRSISFRGITTIDNNTLEDTNYNISLELENTKNAYSQLDKIREEIGGSSIDYNDRLLRLSAEGLSDTFNSSIIMLVAFIMLIIIVATIAVIYNAFNISVIERMEQFGLLRSIGANPKQIKSLVYREALILSLVGIPLGNIAGIFAMKLVFYIISLMKLGENFFSLVKIRPYPGVIIFSSILGLITVFLSAKGPANRAGKVSALEAIRGSENIKKEKIKRIKAPLFIRSFLGIEGEIAYKNLARNKKRFFITTFSMIISIVLFIVFSTFSDMSFTTMDMHTEDNGDFMIYGNTSEMDSILKEIKKIDEVDIAVRKRNISGEAIVEKSKVKEKLSKSDYYNIDLEEKESTGRDILNNIALISLGEDLDILEDKIVKGSIDIDKINSGKGVLVVNSTMYYDENMENHFVENAFNYEVGDKIKFRYYDYNEEDFRDKDFIELEVVGVLKEGDMTNKYDSNGGFLLYTNDKVMGELMGKDSEDEIDNGSIFINLKKDASSEKLKTYLENLSEEDPTLRYTDFAEEIQEVRKFNIIMAIFLYGFVAVISLISAINIINTISTNILVRTKEIGTIKAIGMSQKSVKKMISYEGLYYGLFASLVGGVIASLLTYLLYNIFTGISSFNYHLPIKNILIACLGAIGISILAGKYPLRKINNKLIVESIKEDN